MKYPSNKLFIALFCIVLISLMSCGKLAQTCKSKNLSATVSGSSFESCVITFVPGYPAVGKCWIQAGKGNDQIHLFIPQDTGTYVLGGGLGNAATYGEGIGTNSGISYSTDATNTGSVTITKYDLAGKKISGYFTFDCQQTVPTGGTATKSVSSGVFTDVKW